MTINVGTRGSKLALAQTGFVISELKRKFPEHEINALVIKTTGDQNLNSPLDQLGSKGVFVAEIEEALLNGRIQLAVHSMKDMPSSPLEGLCFAKAWKREDPRDALLLREYKSLKELPKGAVIATGSKRRYYQLLKLRPDLRIVNIRGNIDTRIRRLHEGLPDGTHADGIILAAAGLKRLHLEENVTEYFDVDDMIPAPAQGVLAIEMADSNTMIKEMVNSLSDETTENIVRLERGFLEAIDGDCHLPIGAYASYEDGEYRLRALYGNEEGTAIAKTEVTGIRPDEELVKKAVEDIERQMKEQING